MNGKKYFCLITHRFSTIFFFLRSRMDIFEKLFLSLGAEKQREPENSFAREHFPPFPCHTQLSLTSSITGRIEISPNISSYESFSRLSHIRGLSLLSCV